MCPSMGMGVLLRHLLPGRNGSTHRQHLDNMVINTNISGQQTANNLRATEANLKKSLNRISSGVRIVEPRDDAAGLAVASRMESRLEQLDGAQSNLLNMSSYMQSQEGTLKNTGRVLQRMGELTLLHKDQSKSAEDRELYNKEFTQLKEVYGQLIAHKFNDVPLFGASSANQVTNSEGTLVTLIQITTPTTASLPNINDATVPPAITIAIDSVAQRRAEVGSNLARVDAELDQLSTLEENTGQSLSRIRDADIAIEATEFARLQILSKAGTKTLHDANHLNGGLVATLLSNM